MTGGTLTGPSTGDGNGVYSVLNQSTSTANVPTFVATSDASGNPAVVNAASIGLQSSGSTHIFIVNRGPANPPADMIVASAIIPFGGNISGITKAGNGILELTGVSTYTGSTLISGGTLQLGDGTTGHDGALLSSNTNGVTNNAMLAYNLSGNQTAAYPISGSGSLTKLGTGQLTFSGNNSYTGTTTVSAGVLYINGGDTSAAIFVAGGAAFGGTASLFSATPNVANGGILDYSPVTTSTVFLGGITYAGSSTLKLGPVSNFTNIPLLNAGALTTAGQININANLGAVSVLSGTYDLLNYSSIAGTGTSAFHLASVTGLNLNRFQAGTLLELPGQVDLVITGDTPYWNGNQPDWLSTGAWTLQPSNSATTFISGDTDIFDDSHNTGGTTTVALNIGNVAPLSVTFNNAGLAYTVSGNFGIAGSASMTIQGGGSLTILNSNSYTGGTTLSNGSQLTLGNGGATGSLSPSSTITLGANSVLTFSRSNTMVQGVDFSSSPINGDGNVVQLGPGLLIFTKSNGYTGSTGINGGTLQLGTGVSGQDGALSGTNSVNDNGTLAYNILGNQTPAYQISGGGNLYKTGSGALTLTTSETYTGGTIVNGGTLNLSFGNGGTGTLKDGLTINAGGTVVCTANNVLGYNGGANWLQNITINGGALMTSIAGNDNGWGTTINMTGGTVGSTVAAGYFAMGAAVGGVAPTFNILASNATAVISANLNDRGDQADLGILFNVTRGSAAADLLVSGSILTANGGTAGVTVNGNGITIFTGTNTYPGPTTISGGQLQLGDGLGHDGSISTTSGVFNNGNLVYAIAGTQTAAYAISGTGSLFMTGTGTVVLSASNGYTGSTTVNAGKLYANGPLPNSTVTVNAGLFGGRGTSPGASVATGGSIEGGFNGTGTLTLGLLSYLGSGAFVTNGYANYSASVGTAAPLNVTGSNGLSLGGSPVTINVGGPPAGSAGLYHLIHYSGSLGGSGFGAFMLGTTANNPRGQLSFALSNSLNYVDLSVSVTPVIWTGSLSTAWNANDTLPAPKNWSYSGSATNFQPGDIVLFDNSTGSNAVDISNGNVVPGGITFNNDSGHPYTLTGLNGIGGTGALVKNGAGSLTIATSNGYSGGTNLYAGTLNANAASALGSGQLTIIGGTLNSNAAESIATATLNAGLLVLNDNSAIGTGLLTISGGTLDSTGVGITLPNNLQNWNGNFTFNGASGLNLGTGAVTLGSGVAVNVSGGTMLVGGVISDSGNNYSLTKAGTGAMTLTSANTYTGGTIVNGGTLTLTTGGGVGTVRGPLTINPGALVQLSTRTLWATPSASRLRLSTSTEGRSTTLPLPATLTKHLIPIST